MRSTSNLSRWVPYAAALVTTVLVYVLLHTKYRIFYVDDAWCLSYVHNYAFRGIDMDTLVRPPGHPRSILYFGKSSAFLTAHALNVLGWTKGAAHLVSSAFLFAAAGVWCSIVKSLKFSNEAAWSVALGVLLFPAFFSSANLTRPDTLALLFTSLSLLCFIKERHVFAGFFWVAATEAHIMGVATGFYLLSYALYRRAELLSLKARTLRKGALLALGLALGVSYYYALHYRYFEPVALFRAVTQHSAMAFPIKNFMAAYFFGADWQKKLPELLFTVGMLYLFFRHLWGRAHAFVRILIVVMLASTLVLSRPNGNYMLFVEPALVLVFVHSFELLGKLRKYGALVFGYWMLYYGAIWAVHREFEHAVVNSRLQALLTRAELPVIGMMDDWFAAMDREFYPIYPSAIPIEKRSFEEAYLIRNDYVRKQVGNYDAALAYMTEHFALTKVGEVPAFGEHKAEVFLARRKTDARDAGAPGAPRAAD